MMKAVPVFGVFVSAIALLIPFVFGHPHPASTSSCALTEKGQKKLYKVGDAVELHCPEDKDEKYKVVCTDQSSWLALTECHGKKPTQKPAPPPKPTEKIPDPPKKPENPQMTEPRPSGPRMPRRYRRPMRTRMPMRPRMPDHGPYDRDMRPDHDHRPHDEDYRPMPMPHHPPQPKPYLPPAHTMSPKPTPKRTTKATTTPPHIIPPANQVKPLNKPTRQGISCSLSLIPHFFPYDPFDPHLQRDNVSSGRSIIVRCPGHNFHFYAYCYNGTFYWPQNLCPPGYKR